MLGVLAVVPVLLGLAINAEGPASAKGRRFSRRSRRTVCSSAWRRCWWALPLFLLLAVSVVSGESVAGEAARERCETSLVVPAGRTRLLVVKYSGVLAFGGRMRGDQVAVGIVTGLRLPRRRCRPTVRHHGQLRRGAVPSRLVHALHRGDARRTVGDRRLPPRRPRCRWVPWPPPRR